MGREMSALGSVGIIFIQKLVQNLGFLMMITFLLL